MLPLNGWNIERARKIVHNGIDEGLYPLVS
jgi:hypothetical protein